MAFQCFIDYDLSGRSGPVRSYSDYNNNVIVTVGTLVV